MTSPATVSLWGTRIGAISYSPLDRETAVFEYSPEFLSSGIELAPITMPLGVGRFKFPDISGRTFRGLPGMLADSLPDKFGNQLIDKHMADKGISSQAITAIDRLLYIGTRAMGALEFQPAQEMSFNIPAQGGELDLHELAQLANLTLSRDNELQQKLRDPKNRDTAFNLLRVGTSAGGARAKALVAFDSKERPKIGNIDHGPDHSYWLVKFDGIDANTDRDGNDPPGMTVVEFIYSLMAAKCQIKMPRCKLISDGTERHFASERFDRIFTRNKLIKIHYASWCGLAHAHRDITGAYSYEQLVLLMRQLNLPQSDIAEIFRRAVFNVVGRNQDDHTKNFGFLMNRQGEWSLSPAFDLTYAHDPSGRWTRTHQITLNGKGDDFSRDDLVSFGQHCNVSKRESIATIDRTVAAFSEFANLAADYELSKTLKKTVASQLRLKV